MPKLFRFAPIGALLSLLLLVTAQSVSAATNTVTNTNDSGAGSLRQAIADAAPGDTIIFDLTHPATITVASELEINKSLTIVGPGAGSLAISGGDVARVFKVLENGIVTLQALTIKAGRAPENFGTLTLDNVTIIDNFVDGGIRNFGGTLTINNTTIKDNVGYPCSGVNSFYYDQRNATLTISNSTISNNYSNGPGHAVCATARTDPSGANAVVTTSIINSTISGNIRASGGGGIKNEASVSPESGASTATADLTISNSTLNGDGIRSEQIHDATRTFATVTIEGSVLNGSAIQGHLSAVTSLGYNITSDAWGGILTATGDQINTDPMLGPLQNNGGPTLTHALLPGSPAIDSGDPAYAGPLATDQRGIGFARIVGGRIDIGAFEVQADVGVICPRGQGYWKNNPDAWPEFDELTLGTETYTKEELLAILNTPVGSGRNADASIILAYQLIAAKLNIANGADGTSVLSTITDAEAILGGLNGRLPFAVSPSSPTGQLMTGYGKTLDNFNNSTTTTGCSP